MQHSIEIGVLVRGVRKTHSTCFGKNLREALLEGHFNLYSRKNALINCRGMGICGTCRVVVLENGERVEKRSCQIQCFKPMEIELQ